MNLCNVSTLNNICYCNPNTLFDITRDIYNAILFRDILKRHKLRNPQTLSDISRVLMESYASYGQPRLLQNYGISLIEGMPVDDVPFVAEGTNAVYDAAHAKVQELSATSGFQRDGGYWRMVKKVSVSPNRRYRYSFEFKTEGLTGEQPFKVLAVDATQPWHERETIKPDVKPTQDWTPCAIDFNSCDSNAFYLYIGYMSGRKARDFKLRKNEPLDAGRIEMEEVDLLL